MDEPRRFDEDAQPVDRYRNDEQNVENEQAAPRQFGEPFFLLIACSCVCCVTDFEGLPSFHLHFVGRFGSDGHAHRGLVGEGAACGWRSGGDVCRRHMAVDFEAGLHQFSL